MANKELVIGAYDIHTGTYSDISWSLDDLDFDAVTRTEAITVFENTIYIALQTTRGIDVYSALLD